MTDPVKLIARQLARQDCDTADQHGLTVDEEAVAFLHERRLLREADIGWQSPEGQYAEPAAPQEIGCGVQVAVAFAFAVGLIVGMVVFGEW